jgi:general secretion pathway protein B
VSYILEALKKSDQRRRRDAVPDLQTEHAPGPPQRKKRVIWPWLLVGALLLNAFLLVFFLPSSHRDDILTDIDSPENQTFVPPTPITVENVPDQGTVQPPQRSTALPELPIVTEAHTTAPANTGADPEESAVMPQASIEPAPKETIPENETNELSTVEPDMENTEADLAVEMATDEPEPSLDVELLDLEEFPLEEETAVKPEKPELVPMLDNLPNYIKEKLPELSISFHAFNRAPRSRLVSINGRILREGQSVAEGLILEEITPKGVVLSYQDTRFRIGVF